MANEKRVADIMKQFQNINNNQEAEDLAFIKGGFDDAISGLKGIRKNISPTLLSPHPKNVFSMMHDDEYETLKKAISEYGVTNPILCYEENGKYIILSGHRRTSCALELGLETVPVNIIDKIDNDLDTLTLIGIENMSTRKPSPMDIALFADEMLSQLKKDGVQGRKRDIIAERIPNLKGRMVQSYIKLVKLPDIYKDWVRNGYLSVKNGEALVDLIESKKYDAALSELKDKGNIIIASDKTTEEKEKQISSLIRSIKKQPRPAKKKINTKSEISKINKKLKEIVETEHILPSSAVDRAMLEKQIESTIKKLEKIQKELWMS